MSTSTTGSAEDWKSIGDGVLCNFSGNQGNQTVPCRLTPTQRKELTENPLVSKSKYDTSKTDVVVASTVGPTLGLGTGVVATVFAIPIKTFFSKLFL